MSEFNFTGCVELTELLGKRAEDEQQLLDLIEEVPADSIYYHMHSYFLRHDYIAGAYPNDFASWCAYRIRYLLNNPDILEKIGNDGREYTRRNFLITRHVGNYLSLMVAMLKA